MIERQEAKLTPTRLQIESSERMVDYYMHTEPTPHAIERFLHWLAVLGNLEEIEAASARINELSKSDSSEKQ